MTFLYGVILPCSYFLILIVDHLPLLRVYYGHMFFFKGIFIYLNNVELLLMGFWQRSH